MASIFSASNTINGRFGRLSFNEEIMANVSAVAATFTSAREEIALAGSRITQYKRTSVSLEGSFTIWQASSEFTRRAAEAMSSKRGKIPALDGGIGGFVLEVILADPEMVHGVVEKVLLKRVKLWEIPFGFSTDSLVQQTITFTAEGMEMRQDTNPPDDL